MNKTKRNYLESEYAWATSSRFSEPVQDTLMAAAGAIQNWLQNKNPPNPRPVNVLNRTIGEVFWEPANVFWRMAGFHHVELHTVFIFPERITVETAVHEMAHILDNKFGSNAMAAILGGGPSDEMLRYIGCEPDLFFPRFMGYQYENTLRNNHLELNPTLYGRSRGPAEDFAESFQLAVLNPEILKREAPIRYEWFSIWHDRIISK